MDYRQAFIRLRSHTTGEWFVHPELRPRLVADADAQGSNLTQVAVRILSERYGVPYAENGRRTSPKQDDVILNLRLPAKLAAKIGAAAAQRGAKYQDAIRADLCAHYGLEVPARARAAA